jgi:hypothetical protein
MGIIRKIKEANAVIEGARKDVKRPVDEVAKKREQKQGQSRFQLDSMGRDLLGIVHAEQVQP